MAEYVTVPARNLVPLGDADPVAAAPLADAGLTPYHAIKNALPHLAGGGRFALVIGLGGLGQIAVQILSALTGATVIATDMKEDAMRRAEANGAVAVPGGDGQVEAIREVTGGRGVDAAFDIVGATPTIKTAQASMAQGGRLTVLASPTGPPSGPSSPRHTSRRLPTATGERSPISTRWWRCTELVRFDPRSSCSAWTRH
jgi:propanol-preferring alcohol dehydrogenase